MSAHRWGVAAAALLTLVGCLDRPFEWGFRFAEESVRDQTVMLRGEVWEGIDCDAVPGLARGVDAPNPFMGTEFALGETSRGFPSSLEPGRWSLRVAARNERCEWIAAGCVSLEFPQDDREDVVTISELPDAPRACAACDARRCADDTW